MEKQHLEFLDLKKISKTFPYQIRFDIDCHTLKRSIEKWGVLTPIWVIANQEYTLVSGHRRLAAAKALNLPTIPALVLPNTYGKADLFILSVLSNWQFGWGELDRAMVLKRAVDEFEFQESVLFEEIMPCLGLNPNRKVYQDYVALASLDSSLRDLVANEVFPWQALAALHVFDHNEQQIFASEIATKAALTTGQVRQMIPWFFDLCKIEKKSFKELVADTRIQTVLQDHRLSRKARGEKLYELIRKRRHPQWVHKEESFERQKHRLEGQMPQLSIETPAYFEKAGFSLKIELSDPQSLEQVLTTLRANHKDLNSLFDIMLGH